MHDEAEIELCEPAPFIYYENGQLAVTDGDSVWLVIVTYEAMRATDPSPDEPLRRLFNYAEHYRDLAATAIRRREDVDGKVWVTEAMVNAASSRTHAAAKGVHAQSTLRNSRYRTRFSAGVQVKPS